MARTPEQLWGPIAKAQLATRGVTAGTGFGNTEGLRISGKRFDAGKGRPMKEWASITPSASRRWRGLVDEARAFVGGR